MRLHVSQPTSFYEHEFKQISKILLWMLTGTILLFVLTLYGCTSNNQQDPATTAYEDNHNSDEYSKPIRDVFQDLKYGLFIHWGPVSVIGKEISWSRRSALRQKIPGLADTVGEVPTEIYDSLYTQFNPTNFDAEAIARAAKSYGMKYIVFTTKHCDGFCNFNTKYTNYKITSPNSPYRKDIVRQLADACQKYQLRFGLYYSLCDWYNPDYRTSTHSQYIIYYQNQIRELLTNYGNIDILWFDDLGGTVQDWDSYTLRSIMTQLQPNLIVNERWGHGPGNLAGDFISKEDGFIATNFDNSTMWEGCFKLASDGWSWIPNASVKSTTDCIKLLTHHVACNGNVLLGVGPRPDGTIEERQVQRLQEIGYWVKNNAKAIYGTRGGPYMPSKFVYSTYKDNKVYLMIHNFDGRETIDINNIQANIVSSKLLNGTPISVTKSWWGGLDIYVPEKLQDDAVTIVELTLDRKASEVPLIP